jgi:hypothetical protein
MDLNIQVSMSTFSLSRENSTYDLHISEEELQAINSQLHEPTLNTSPHIASGLEEITGTTSTTTRTIDGMHQSPSIDSDYFPGDKSESGKRPKIRLSIDFPTIPEESSHEIRCWICYVDYNESRRQRWVKPCKCKGSLGYLHEACLLKYIASKDTSIPQCPQCQTPYRMVSPVGFTLKWMMWGDKLIHFLVPYTLLAGSGLVTLMIASAYGAYALVTLSGAEAETWLMNPEWGWRVWMGLPLIPLGLIGSRLTFLDHVLPVLPLWIMEAKSFQLHWPPTPSTSLLLLPWIRYL